MEKALNGLDENELSKNKFLANAGSRFQVSACVRSLIKMWLPKSREFQHGVRMRRPLAAIHRRASKRGSQRAMAY